MSRHQRSSTVTGGECLVVSVPLTMKRRGGRKQVIAPDGRSPDAATPARTNASLELTIARAHCWRALLEEGRYTSVRALAQALGVDNSYLARLLRLTLLAPDIAEAILEGTEPGDLSLEKLYRAPVDWESQRRRLGLTSPPTP